MKTRTCRACNAPFNITDDDCVFYEKVSPVIGGKVMSIPPPTHCPDCRQQRRITFRNDQHYYRHTCVICQKSLISIYSPDKNIPVLCEECFWSDRFDPFAYGQEIDFGRPFLEQFAAMRARVPRLAIYHTQSENSEYTVHSSRNRNCYMSSSLVDDDEVHYSDFTFESRDSMDLFSCGRMELCYECIFCEACYSSDFLELCTNVADCVLCFDCKGSNNLVGCVGVRNRENLILNEAVTVEECRGTAQRVRSEKAFRVEFLRRFEALKLRVPKHDAWMINCENCLGNYILNSKNVQYGYNMKHFEDCRYVYEGHKDTDCCDIMRCASSEALYDCIGAVDLRFSAFCNLCYQCDQMLYCDNCQASSSCLGCMSVKRGQYCILNRTYKREEYEELVPRLFAKMQEEGAWGEFFPIPLSPFGYNETKAMEWYPLEKDAVLARGWKWSDYEQPFPEVSRIIDPEDLPGGIADVSDNILECAIRCEVTGKPFRIIKQELEFYRKKGLPIPHRSPQQRHRDRMAKQNPRKLFDRTCMKCGKPIKTTYAPDRPEIVYCESCYLETVY